MSSFIVRAAHTGRVYIIFDVAMAPNSDLTNPNKYFLRDAEGNLLSIGSVDVVSSNHIRSVGLNLLPGNPLVPGVSYVLDISSVVTETNDPLTISSSGFTWNPPSRSIHIPVRPLEEVSPPMQIPPPGEIFFSPAYQISEVNSAIQVDEIEVCTRAFDVYQVPPTRPLATPLFTYSPTYPPSLLNKSLLVGRFDELGEARINVSDFHLDTATLPVDSNAVATLQQPFDPSYVSFLNNPYWILDNNPLASTAFITANLLSGPVPSGSTTVVVLEP